MIPAIREGLIVAAQFERDLRLARAARKIGEGGDAQAITIDCQCWVAIAEWIDTGRFFGFHGGVEPHEDSARWIGYPELEAAAEAALGRVTAQLGKMEADPAQDQVAFESRLTAEQWLDRLTDLTLRRARLACLHELLATRRATVDSINAELRQPKLEAAA